MHTTEKDGDDNESVSGGSSVAGSQCDTSAQSKISLEKTEVIAKAENSAVFRLRLIVIAVLVTCTVGVAVAVYLYTSNEETIAFEASFHDDSTKIFEAIGTSLDLSLGAIDAFVVGVVSFARFSNSSWPFVTVPDYAARIAKVRSLTKGVMFGQYQIVSEEQRVKWEKYSMEHAGWVDETLLIQKGDKTFHGKQVEQYYTSPVIFGNWGDIANGTAPYYPTWQSYPSVPIYPPFNWDGSEYPSLVQAFETLDQDHQLVISNVANLPNPENPKSKAEVKANNDWIKDFVGPEFPFTEPYSDIYYPIFDKAADAVSLENEHEGDIMKMVGILGMTFYWRDLIENILPPDSDGTVVVFKNACNQTFTYMINGPDVEYLGFGDLHDTSYDYMEQQESKLSELNQYATGNRQYTGLPLSENSCPYQVQVYPSKVYENRFTSNKPLVFTITAVAIFAFTAMIFFFYDVLVERRQKKVMTKAVQSSAIVSSLFPSNVRSRLYEMEKNNDASAYEPQKSRLQSYLREGRDASPQGDTKSSNGIGGNKDRPIADLFAETTVMFADIAGFTAWSSIREPSHVFVLLETLYGALDAIAVRRRVFKVETIGDSYVAVAGLPEPRADHAVVMAKFARDCRIRMSEVTRRLGVTLGPDTEDLAMRLGLHSGPVTAGVLRGQKSRFQLFGDTVNTASRMESTGILNRIQVSQSTADQLIKAKKGHWLVAREDTVDIKGKGSMQTYWVEPKTGTGRSETSDTNASTMLSLGDKIDRLVDWNTDVMERLIRHIIVRRSSAKKSKSKLPKLNGHNSFSDGTVMVLDEVTEIIELPEFNASTMGKHEDPDSIELDPTVATQLREYVESIATSYHSNPFHNFEHASHVAMSVTKLLSRIVAADDAYDISLENGNLASSRHDLTYGITSDPLTQFACVYAALIHDVDHSGLPNTQLVKEDSHLARKYHGRSVAEQNSVDIAWGLFMDSKYSELRAAICPTQAEMNRFRQLVVNSVMATDIMDKDLKTLRNARWDKAFSETAPQDESQYTCVNRKATIVIEHLIQASDVAHTMQHWHIYRKWNERLFEELHRAYKAGRAERDPSEFWYEGELGFFDFYILPLAKKLSECGVFGVSSDEYLNYALKNREEWECRGKEAVAGMVERLNSSSRVKT